MADAAVLILERNKHNLTEFYDTIFNQCRPEMPSSSMWASTIGAQVADGKEAFIDNFERMAMRHPGNIVEHCECCRSCRIFGK